MKNIVFFLIDKDAGFVYGKNPKARQVRILQIDPSNLGELAELTKKEGLIMTTQGGIAITQVLVEKAAASPKTTKKK